MRRALTAAVLAVVAMPEAALACPTCVSSAFGDRAYNWAYLGLILMPFALTAVVGAIVAARLGWQPRVVERLSHVKAWFGEISFFSDRSTRPAAAKAWFGKVSFFSDRSTRPAAGPHLAHPLPRKKHGGST